MRSKLFLFYALTCSAIQTLHATPVSLENYCTWVGEINPERQNILTLNKKGSAYCFTTKLTESFLHYCQNPAVLNVLEIGCAYGIKSSQIVQKGVNLTANDLESEHLKIMRYAFDHFSSKNSDFSHVKYLQGNIVNLPISSFEDKKFDAILIESVLHFLTPEEIQHVLKKFNSLLNDNGRLYILTSSPFLKHLEEEYQKNKTLGKEWPGFFENPEAIHPTLARLHKPYHCFDEATLHRELILAGFNILESDYLAKPHQEHDMALDDREGLMVIAEKEPSKRF